MLVGTITPLKIDCKQKQPEAVLMVRERGLEPPRLAAHAPKACVSTNSTTRARQNFRLCLVLPYKQKRQLFARFFLSI